MVGLDSLLDALADDGFVLEAREGRLICHGPRGRRLDDGVAAELRRRRTELIRYLTQVRRRAQRLAPIPAIPRAGDVPLSPAQRRLRFLETYAGGSTGAYHVPTHLRLVGALDVAALRQSLTELVRRHDILRSVFVETDGEPAQRVLPPGPVELRAVQLDRASLDRAIRAEAAVPFDLRRGPLWRARLWRVSATEHHLLLVQHHIVSDGRSIELYLHELAALYADAHAGRAFSLPAPALQYADYVAWQRDHADAGLIEAQLAWWASALEGCEPLALITDGQRPAEPAFRGAQHHARLPAATRRAVEALARERRTTPFAVLLASFQTLLHFWSGQDDVTIVIGVSGRDHPDLADLPGLFVNLLPVRTRFAADPCFADVVDAVRGFLHEALARQDVPLERMLRAAGFAAEGASNPLLRVMLVMQAESAIAAPAMSGLDVTVTPEADQDIAKADLTLSLQPSGDAIDMRIEYDTDLFRPETIACLGAQLTNLLDSVTQSPTTTPRAAALLTAAGFRRFVLDAGRTEAAYPRGAGLARLFAEQVARTPDAVAIVDGDRALSYRELDRRARELASRLPARHPSRTGFPSVAVCMERRLELAVALVAIVKAGAAYVPLDPGYPEVRLRYILDEVDAAATLVCGLEESAASALQRAGRPVVSLDDPPEGAGVPIEPDAAVPAYVCFTSGTTGAPKGVVIEQDAVARLVLNTDYVRLGPGARVGMISNPVFDAITFELWGALLNGGALFVFARDIVLDADAFATQLDEQRIETIFLTTALFDAFARHRPAMFRHLRHLLVGGSALTPATVAAVLNCPEGRPERFLNIYGPTENTTFSVCHEVVVADPGLRAIPIGRPIANSTAYVLDPDGRPLPPCVPGELWVGGDGLGRAYLNQAALTAERFVFRTLSHPEVATQVTARLYRTGDVVRLLPDGAVDYVGRRDRQVKINGFRVEPGEVEARIAAHPDIRQCAVRAIEAEGRRRLVAWYATRDGADLPEAALRDWLEQGLPPYMVPALLVRRQRLPTTPGGKIDLNALEIPDLTVVAAPPALPAGDAVAKLIAIWRDVLRVDAIGPDDDFFVIGGDSILSIQVVARARQCGLSMAPRMIFEHRTPRRIAAAAEATRAASPRTHGHGRMTLTPIQRWFFELDLAAPDHFNQAFLLVPPARIGREMLADAVSTLLGRHPVLSTRFRRDAAGAWQPVAGPAAAPDVHETTWPADAADDAFQAVLTDWQSAFSLEEGRLLAAGLVSHADGRQHLFLAVHHLVVDIVSWRVLFDDLFQLLADPAARLPAPSAAFAEWSGALEDFAAGAARDARDHWLRFAAAETPLDSPAGPVRTRVARLDRAATDDLLHRAANGFGTTPYELLLAATAMALHACGRSGTAIWLEGHGREDAVGPDVSRTIGWFTSQFPFQLSAPAGTTDAALEDLLVATKEALRAVPHRGLSFGVLRELAPDEATRRALRRVEVAPVTVNYLGRFDAMLGEGWRIAPEAPGEMVSAANRPTAGLDVAVLVIDGGLELRAAGAADWLSAERLDTFVDAFLAAARRLISLGAQRRTVRLTPSDYPDAGLTAEELARVQGDASTPPAAIYRLTPLQEGLLFHALHSPASDQYVVQLEWSLHGPIDAALLRRAWQDTAAAQDALRTRFAWAGLRHPVQVVERDVQIDWQAADLDGDAASRLAMLKQADRARGFDLAAAPAWRVLLARLGDARFALVWTHHHILLDGWSAAALIKEVAARYAALLDGRAPELPGAPAFGAYVSWLLRQDRATALAWWQGALAGIAAPTDVPVRRPGTQPAAHAAIAELGACRLELDARLTRRLGTMAQQAGATLNAVVQLAWALVLQRYAGNDEDVVFGTVVSGRANDFAGAERVVGLAANVVPLRVKLADDDALAAALAATHRLVEDAGLHSHVSLADIQSVTAVPAGTPLIHTATAFENYPDMGTAADALHAVAADVDDKTNFPLLLLALPGEALQLRLQYDAGLFDADAMAAMLGHVAQALHGMAEAPGTLGAIDIVAESARLRDLALASGEAVPPAAASVVSLFRTQVEQCGSVVAVEAEEGCLSYAELWAAAERLAGVLRARHRAVHGHELEPDTRIGLCLERGLGMGVAVWGVLLAGAAYVPLDPEHPQGRLEFLVSDSACALIVSTRALAGRLGAEVAARTVLLEGHLPAADAPAEAPPAQWGGPAASDLAYVIYTSGSTGRPKGAMIEHRSLVNRIAWMRAAYGLGAADRVLQKTPFSFDVSVWELVLPVVSGARIVFARPGGHRDPAYLADLIVRREITVLHFVPSMLRVFLEPVDARRLEGLRLVFCSGEALPGDLARRLLAALPRIGLHNLYGPTEAAVDVSFHRCAPDEAAAVAPIGRPVWNTQLHVLDDRMRPAPGGVAGELWIGGVQVGRGYLNRDALTAERFIEGRSGEGRLYRTGDRVRRRADGVLEYLGRTDFQLKLRGYRIEPGEIEAALETVPGVRQACVVARHLGGEPALVGYLAADDAPVDAELRRALAALLPGYMIPARFVRLAALPLNTAGKVDRRQLPEPGQDARAPAVNRQPGNVLTAAIAEIAADVLGRDVGAKDDLFALGAHSLHVVRIAARLSQRLRRDVPLSAVFEERTAARLAASLAGGNSVADTIAVLDRTQTLRPSAAQERLWFLDRLVADRATYNVPYALRLRGPFNTDAWQAAVDRMVAAHEILRANIVALDGAPALVVRPDRRIRVTVEATDAARLPGRLEWLARETFDLAKDALLRVHVLELADDEHVLFLCQHHLVTDGWSVGVLLRQLAAAYEDALHGRPQARPPAVQYADLAAWQRARLRGAREAELLEFWRAELADALSLELRTDRPRPAVMRYRGAVHRFTIDAADTALLHALSRRCGATLFATLLAGFNLLLTRWTGQDDIVVGTPVANRRHAAQEDALGLFANTIVLRNRIDQDSTVADVVAAVARRAVRALSHQDMPFERLVEALGVARDTSRTPLFQVFFILQNAGGPIDLALPGLTVEPLPLDTGTAKFDLTLSLEEREGRLSGVIEYASDLFDASTIALIGGAYRALLAGMAASPDRAARELAPVSGVADRAPPRPAAPASRQDTLPRAVPADAPSTETERLVGEVWREVLAIDAVPLHTSFFELGGSSLGLMRVQARLTRALQRDVPMVDLFANPTVACLAAWLDGAREKELAAAQPSRPVRTIRGPRARPLG